MLMTFPAFGKDGRSGVGVGYNTGTVDSDIFITDFDFVGFNVFYKWGISDRWGVLVSFRDMEDDESFAPGEELEYTQIGVHAVIMWRHGNRVRPHVKFGIASTDMDFTSGGLTVSDDDVTFSFGGGLEAGSDKVAFFGDFDYTEPELNSGFGEFDFEVANLTLGIIFKF